jgi:hypothetical protein
MPRTRRTYIPEFKAEAVKLVTERGRASAAELASPHREERPDTAPEVRHPPAALLAASRMCWTLPARWA